MKQKEHLGFLAELFLRFPLFSFSLVELVWVALLYLFFKFAITEYPVVTGVVAIVLLAGAAFRAFYTESDCQRNRSRRLGC